VRDGIGPVLSAFGKANEIVHRNWRLVFEQNAIEVAHRGFDHSFGITGRVGGKEKGRNEQQNNGKQFSHRRTLEKTIVVGCQEQTKHSTRSNLQFDDVRAVASARQIALG
jgi:hypothetical protein